MQIFMNLDGEKDIEEVIKYNIEKAKKIRAELVELEKTISHSETVLEEYEDDIGIDIEPEYDEEEEYKYYYDNIKTELKNANTLDEITTSIYENLPVLENKNYDNLIRRIILELVKEKYEYEELKQGEDGKTIEELSKEQEKIDDIISIIRNHANLKVEENTEVTEKKNNLIFLETFNGSIYVEGDLASIDQEYYEGFKELIDSIAEGTFKNVKRFASNHGTLKGITEVKGFQIRVVFDKIDNDTYIVLHAFIKKTNRNLGYLEQLCNRIDYYKKNKDAIIARIDDKYIEENNKIYENLKNGLNTKNIVKTKRYR